MDRLFDRLETLVKAWVNTTVDSNFSQASPRAPKSGYGDPDLDAAMAELDDFLDTSRTETEKREKEAERRAREEAARRERASRAGSGAGSQSYGGTQGQNTESVVRDAYRYLGLEPFAPFTEVKTAYRKLLFKYHPDRNSADQAQLKKATETSARINAAFQIIEAWEAAKKAR